MTDFIAIDFETATRQKDSACAVGLAVVQDLKIVDYFDALIQPPQNRYEGINVSIHGITPDMTENAPSFDELWWQLRQWFSEHVPLVAHGANFDVSVLRSIANVDIPNFVYLDTINMVSPYVSGKKSLDNCTAELGISLDHHHDAKSDAVACAELAIEALKRSGCVSMWEYIALNPQILIRRFQEEPTSQSTSALAKTQKGFKHLSSPRPSEITPTVLSIAPNSPLYKKSVVFTGELTIDRGMAMQMAVNAGAVVKTAVSRKTNYLVVGVQDKAIVGADGLSSKEEKAYRLNESGEAFIRIIDEESFIRLCCTGGGS